MQHYFPVNAHPRLHIYAKMDAYNALLDKRRDISCIRLGNT